MSGRPVDLGGDLATVAVTFTATTSLNFDDGSGARAFEARPLAGADLGDLTGAADKLRLSGGVAVISIDIPAAAAGSGPRALFAALDPGQSGVRLTPSSRFTVGPPAVSVERVTLTDGGGDGTIDSAEVQLSRSFAAGQEIPPARFRLELNGDLGASVVTATGITGFLDQGRLEVSFGGGLPTTAVDDLVLRIDGGTVLRTDAATGTLVDLGPEALDASSLNSSGAPVLRDGAPPVLVSSSAADTDGDGGLDQLRLTFSEGLAGRPGAASVVGRLLADPSAVGLAAGDDLALAVDGAVTDVVLPLDIPAGSVASLLPAVQSALDRAPPAGLGPGAVSILLERPPSGAGGRFVLRIGTPGAGHTLSVTGGTAAAKLGFDGSQLDVPGSGATGPGIDDFLVVGSTGESLLDGITDADISVAGSDLTVALDDQEPAGGTALFVFLDGAAGASLADAAGNAASPATNFPAGALDPSASPLIRVRDSDASPGDGVITSRPGVVTLDPSVSLIPAADAGAVRLDVLDTGADLRVFVEALDWAGVAAPALDAAPGLALADPIRLAAFGHGPGGLLQVRISTQIRTGAPLALLAGPDGRVSREFTVAILDVAPRADAGPEVQAAALGAPFVLDATASDDPNAEDLAATATFAWTVVPPSGSASTLSGPRPAFTPVEPGAHRVTLVVTDEGGLASAPASVTLVATGTGADQAPAADAGPDVVARVGGAVTLDGRASFDPSGGGLAYHWSLLDPDGNVTAADVFPTTEAQPSFTAAAPGTTAFRLVVTDPTGGPSAPDDVTVTVVDDAATPPLVPPVARIARLQPAGPGVAVFDPVVLSGQQSAGTRPLTGFSWRQVEGPEVEIDDAASPTLTFLPVLPGTYGFELRATDSAGLASPPARATLVATPGGASATVAAGADFAAAGPDVALGTSASVTVEPALGVLALRWRQLSGPPTVLGAPASLQTTFTAPAAGVYRFALEASAVDPEAHTTLRFGDELLAGVSLAGLTLPTASLAAQALVDGSFLLDGSGSAPAGVEFRFQQVDGLRSVLEPQDPSGSPVLFVPVTGDSNRFVLEVLDPSTGLKSLPADSGILGGTTLPTLVVADSPASTQAGSPFALRLELQDGFGGLAGTVTATATVAISTGPAGAVLGGTTSQPFQAGAATFDDLTLTRAGSYGLGVTVTLDAGGILTADVPLFVNLPGPATALRVTAEPSSTTAGVPFTVGAELRDAFDNLSVTATATMSVSLDTAPAGASLSGVTSAPFVNGAATLGGLGVDLAGSYGLTVRADVLQGGVLTGSTRLFTNEPGAPASLVVTSAPSSTTAGIPFTVGAELRDAFDNVASTATATAAILFDTAPSGAHLGGVITAPFASGAVTFPDLTVDKAGTYRLSLGATILGGGSLSALTGTFLNGAGAPTQLLVTSSPSSPPPGSPSRWAPRSGMRSTTWPAR